MTFPELVIKARYRLHDIRTADGAIITDAATDGIRWSSTQLTSLCKGAIHELLRTLRGFVARDKSQRVKSTLNNFINNSVQTQIVTCKIEKDSGNVSGLPDKFYKLHRLQAPDFSLIYDEVDAEVFFSKKWRLLDISSIDECPIDERWFCPVWDADKGKIVVKTIPILTEDITNVRAILTLPIDSLLTLTSTTDLPFVDLDDIILDFIERQGSIEEHNPQQAKYLMELITLKLGLIINELQESNR